VQSGMPGSLAALPARMAGSGMWTSPGAPSTLSRSLSKRPAGREPLARIAGQGAGRIVLVSALLVVGDTFRSPELRHEVPLGVPDQFLFAEVDGGRHVVVTSFEVDRIVVTGDITAHAFEEYGYDGFIAQGLSLDLTLREVFANACAALGIRAARVPDAFPLAVAERLRKAGVELAADQAVFDDRRRVKNAAELAGI